MTLKETVSKSHSILSADFIFSSCSEAISKSTSESRLKDQLNTAMMALTLKKRTQSHRHSPKCS